MVKQWVTHSIKKLSVERIESGTLYDNKYYDKFFSPVLGKLRTVLRAFLLVEFMNYPSIIWFT